MHVLFVSHGFGMPFNVTNVKHLYNNNSSFNLITEGYSIKIVASLDIDTVKISNFVITCNLVKKKNGIGIYFLNFLIH